MLHKSTKELTNQPIIDHYRLMHFLHRGKNKSVYQAIDIHTAKPVALKLLRLDQGPDEKQLRFQYFMQNMQQIIALDYPYIFPVFDFGKMASEQEQKYEYAYIVMPIAMERSLDIWLQNWQKQNNLSPQLPLRDIRQLVRQTAQSLQYAHDNNVLHLGIKQTNFLIHYSAERKQFPRLELSDFSIARFTHLAQHYSSETEVSYTIAPEQLNGTPEAASDQYALAAMVYELLTGSPYIPKMQHKVSPISLLPNTETSQLTSAINEVLQRALSVNSYARYPSISEFSEEFEHAARKSEAGESIHLMLGVSMTEALAGVSYPLILPDQQRVTITIPPNAQAGQTLHIPKAGRPAPFDGPKGSLIVTLAIRPNPNENQQVVEQLQHLSKHVQTLQTQPGELQQKIEMVDQKVTHLLNSHDEDDVQLRGLQDVPDYLKKHISPGLAIVFSVVMISLIFCNLILMTTLRGAIITNGNTNTRAIEVINARIAATASAYADANIMATKSAQATKTATQDKYVKDAIDAQAIPQQYHIANTSNSNLIFNDLVNSSDQGQWSTQNPANDQSCYFGSDDKLYHTQMISKHNTSYLCQTSNAAGVFSTDTTFVIQVQMMIINGDFGGIAFGISGKSFCYFYIDQYGHYEIGINNIPFSMGQGLSNAINKGTDLNVSNLLGVVVNKTTLTFYANLQPIFSVQAVQIAPAGKVALIARSDGSPTNVAYQKIKLWRY